MFDVNTLGSLNLVFVSTVASSYYVVDVIGDPDDKQDDEYVPLRSSDGARLAFSAKAETDMDLVIISFGDTLDIAQARRTAIETQLVAARNYRTSGVVTTYVEKDTSNAAATTWRIVGGKMTPITQVPGMGRPHGFLGKFVAPALVHLVLSKN